MNAISLNRANTVATVTRADDLDFLSCQKFFKSEDSFGFDALEFRLDNLAEHLDKAEEVVKKCRERFAILITVRRPDEGGAGNLGDTERAALYHRFLTQSHLLDLEVRSLGTPEMDAVIRAREKATGVVASFHDFNRFPGRNRLDEIVLEAFEKGADIAKIAVYVDNFRDLDQLVALIEAARSQDRQMSVMGMGPLGKLSRLVLAKAGSCLNYGYLQIENAPGQWSATRLAELIREL